MLYVVGMYKIMPSTSICCIVLVLVQYIIYSISQTHTRAHARACVRAHDWQQFLLFFFAGARPVRTKLFTFYSNKVNSNIE